MIVNSFVKYVLYKKYIQEKNENFFRREGQEKVSKDNYNFVLDIKRLEYYIS